jgi:hypothetical protein
MTFEGDFPDEELVAALRVNRNAIVLMDSDGRAVDSPLKARVQRVREEAQRSGTCDWVTAGRTVENYIPTGAMRLALNDPGLGEPGQYADVFEYTGRSNDKVRLAGLVIPRITREMLGSVYDLAEQLDRVCRANREWNGLPEPADSEGREAEPQAG